MRVLEAIQRSAEYLERRGVESPRLQSEWMLSQVLKIPRLKLYLDFERELEPSAVDALREMVRRRGRREPLQYILGTAVFCGLEIAVSPDVLIPRPETELLAERAWTWLRERTGTKELRALDVGTGSGCLAIALAVHEPRCEVIAIDVSKAALDCARANGERAGCAERLAWRLGDGFEALEADERFDLMVSNPPYIPRGELGALEPEVRCFEPRLALDGGVDGLDFYRRLAREGTSRLNPGGVWMMEVGFGQAESVAAILTGENWIVREVIEDYHRVRRHLVAGR